MKEKDRGKAEIKNFSFTCLEKKLKEALGIEKVNDDILKTLGLKTKDGKLTEAGLLFSDEHSHDVLDIARFGKNKNIIKGRYELHGISLLEAYDKGLEIYKNFYHYEIIKGAYREKVIMVPELAFREALANALVHRDWLRDGPIQISMEEESITITSPGGLPNNLSVEEYLHSEISVMRNPSIGALFFRLNIIEKFGTGVKRIQSSYEMSKKKPLFTIYPNTLVVELPVITGTEHLSKDKKLVYEQLEEGIRSSSDLVRETGFGKNKVIGLVDELIKESYVEKIGSGRGTRYKIKE